MVPTYSAFAKRRMERRGITESEVTECLENPTSQYSVEGGDTVFVMQDRMERLLKVRTRSNADAGLTIIDVVAVTLPS